MTSLAAAEETLPGVEGLIFFSFPLHAPGKPSDHRGAHLPDITVITPVWEDGEIVFFVASRGHHADAGGISPGSMPPNSKSLAEEGATIISYKLVQNGVFQVRTTMPSCAPAVAQVAYGWP